MQRTIVHVDIPRFMASVETALEPTLKTKAFVVVPRSIPRAPVLDLSLEAWRDGVRKGMTFQEARKIIPQLRAVEPHWNAGRDLASRLARFAHSLTPWLEQSGQGHLFLDADPRIPPQEKIRREISAMGPFNCVIGIGTNKLVAKVADRAFKLFKEQFTPITGMRRPPLSDAIRTGRAKPLR